MLRSYGISGLQHYIRHHIKLAKRFEELVLKDKRFEICNQVKVSYSYCVSQSVINQATSSKHLFQILYTQQVFCLGFYSPLCGAVRCGIVLCGRVRPIVGLV